MMAGKACATCGGYDFDIFEAARFCRQCGSQSQAHATEIAGDEVIGIFGGRAEGLHNVRRTKDLSQKILDSQSQTIVSLEEEEDEKEAAFGALSALLGTSVAQLSQAMEVEGEQQEQQRPKTSISETLLAEKAGGKQFLPAAGLVTHARTGLGRDVDRIVTFTKVLRRLTDDLIDMRVLKESCRARVFNLWTSYLSRLGVIGQRSSNFEAATRSGDKIGDSDESESTPTESEDEERSQNAQDPLSRKASKAATCYNFWPALILIAAHEDGSSWLLFSDLIRWLREGRLKISDEEMIFGITAKTDTVFGRRKYTDPVIAEHLSVAYRAVVFLSHFLSVPRGRTTVDFGEVTARLLWNANLPTAILHRVHYLTSLLPPKCKLEDWSRTPSDYPGNPINVATKGNVMLQQLSAETKAAVYIVMAVKLILALDDCFEVVMSEKAKAENSNMSRSGSVSAQKQFVWCNWVKQTKLRRAVRRGEAIKKVLSPSWYDNSELETNKIVGIHRYFHGAMGSHIKRQLGNCGISNFRYDPDNVQVFMDGYSFVPPADTALNQTALLAPLQWVADKNKDLIDASHGERNSGEVFFWDFAKDSLGFLEDCQAVEAALEGHYTEEVEALTQRATGQRKEKILKLFPAANRYRIYPLITRESVVGPNVTDEEFLGPQSGRYNQHRFQKQLETDFSESFTYFLTFMAEIIGEDRGFVFFVLQCLEEGIFGIAKREDPPLMFNEELFISSRTIDDILPQL